MRTPLEPREPMRGWAGRFTAGPGKSSNAHAMRGPRRPRPDEIKRLHAVSPRMPTLPRSMPNGPD